MTHTSSTHPTFATVSIGIPAYNEAIGIKRLLGQILEQAEDDYRLLEIIIASDGSTDGTNDIVRGFTDPRIKLIASTKRLGKTTRLNQILESCQGDVILMLDADIHLPDRQLIARTIRDFHPHHGLLGFNCQPLPGRTFVERCINAGIALTHDLAAQWNDGVNYLPYRGAALMVSRQFARQLHLPEDLVTNDAYFFFMARHLGYQPIYCPERIINYRSPGTISDHLRQSHRFQYSAEELARHIPDFNPHASYDIPRRLMLTTLLSHLVRHPIHLTGYIAISLYGRLICRPKVTVTWDIAGSTKQ